MKNLFLLLLFIGCGLISSAQDIDFLKKNFKENPKGFKEAFKHYQLGEDFFMQNKYEEALKEYYIANKFNENSSKLNSRIGETFMKTAKKNLAHTYLLHAFDLNPEIDGYYVFLLGKSFHFRNEFDEAIKYYKKARTRDSKVYPAALEIIDRKITECTNGKLLKAKPGNFKLELLPGEINTADQEYVPVINADETMMIFTSRKKETTGGGIDEGLNDYYEDIYVSDKIKGKWTKAENIEAPVNSDRHDATVALSVDGQILFLYRDNKRGDGDIYMSTLDGDDWSEPEELPEPINSKAQETSACFSPDGNTIYFVSDRDGGKGGKDIYYSTKNDDDTWGEAVNIEAINSAFDEDAVFLHPDGKTFYFSSKGFNSMGGFDIFTSTIGEDEASWSAPKNIGYPLNSSDDDVSVVLTANGDYGYYTSIRPEGMGKRDIYRITFLDEINKPKMVLLKGVIKDKETGKPIAATIEIFDNKTNKKVSTFKSNSKTGKYMLSIPAGANYGIHVRAKGYMFYSEIMKVDKSQAFKEMKKNIFLDKLKVGTKVVLKNVFYDFGKATLSKTSFNELNIVAELLTKNPKLRIELSAHTDSRGSDAFNMKLSNSRAHSCVDYLVNKKGIDKGRLIAKGYGETQPKHSDSVINKKSSEEEQEQLHQENRRTEFKIIK